MNNTDTRKTSRSGIFISNFEHISHFFLVFQLMILNIYLLAGSEREIHNKLGVIYPKSNTPQLKLGLIN